MQTEILAQIDAPHFVAAIVLRGDRVIEAAPIVRFMRGWDRDRVRDYCRGKGWRVAVVTSTTSASAMAR